MIRKFLVACLFSLSLPPAFAQAPAPVPALPDAERRTTYTITTSNCACGVGFALFGDAGDFQNWIEVFVNGIRVNYNDPTFGWTITSPSGPLSSLARPISNAVLTFNSPQSGVIQIVGARRPRRTSQFNENQGVPARNLNQVLTDIISQNREIWDKTNDMTGRAVLGLPGETISPLPAAAARAGKFATYDGLGNPTATAPTLGTGNVLGPVSSINGHVATFAGIAGTQLADSGFFPVQPITCAGSQWINLLAASGIPTCAQPNLSDLAGSGVLASTNTTDSSSPTTGAIVTAGGIGAAKNIVSGASVVADAAPGFRLTSSSVPTVSASGGFTSLNSSDGTGSSVQLGNSTTGLNRGFFNATAGLTVRDSTGVTTYSVTDANGVQSAGYLGSRAPVTKTGTSSTVAAGDSSIIYNASGTHTTTLPAAASFPGRWLFVRSIAAQAVNSASSNVVPLAGGAASTGILAATTGKWAWLQSDATNWQIMAAN